jgi:histidinol-phosphate aminotransferase
MPRFVPLDAGAHDLEAMAGLAAEAAMVWLPSPHNPTGVSIAPHRLPTFLRELPPTCLVVLDEAYRSFVDPERRPDVGRLLAEHPNLVVQRTFSKEYGLAGLRIGYALASAEIVDALRAIRPPFSVNVAGIAAARVALTDRAWRDYTTGLVRRARDRLLALLTELEIEHFPSHANFVTLRAPRSAELLAAVDSVGLSVRDGADLGLAGWLRISVGAAPQMAVLHEALRRHVERA